jgi:hypothetical protein
MKSAVSPRSKIGNGDPGPRTTNVLARERRGSPSISDQCGS